MTKSNGLYEARGQIAWILALIISTAVVVRLEQLELGAQLSVLTTNPLGQIDVADDMTLQRARLRVADPATADVVDQVHLLTALVLAATQAGADEAALRGEAAQAIAAIEGAGAVDLVLLDAIRLCRRVFRF